jgi:hypothetical protein
VGRNHPHKVMSGGSPWATVPLMSDRSALTEDERAELQRLRAEVARLRTQDPRGVTGPAEADGPGGRQRWRSIVATLLIVVGCLLAPLSVVAVWSSNQVTNTDRYLATVSPLIDEPAIQDAIADEITAQVFSYIDVEELTTQAIAALENQGLPAQLAPQLQALAGPIANGIEGFTRTQVDRVVASDAFADAWVQANRVAHEELVAALTGEGSGSVTIENDTVSLNMAAFIETVKEQLVSSGFTLAERIPAVDVSFVLFQSADVTRARSAFNLLDTLGNWLPIIALILIVVGVYVAKNHRRALVGAAVGVAVGMVVLALGLAVFRSYYLNAVPDDVLPHDAAALLYDTIVRFLRLGLRTVLVLALIVAAAAFLAGPSVTAVRTRHGFVRGIGWVRGSAEQAGWSTGPVGAWVYRNKKALRVGALAVAALALVFWGRPTGQVVIGLTLGLLVVLAVIEFLGRPPAEPEQASSAVEADLRIPSSRPKEGELSKQDSDFPGRPRTAIREESS